MRRWVLPVLFLSAGAGLAQDLNWLDAAGASRLRGIFAERRDQLIGRSDRLQVVGRQLDERDAAQRAWYERRSEQLMDGIEVLDLIIAGRELSDDYFGFVARAFEVYDGPAEAPAFVSLIPRPRLLEPENEGAIQRDVAALVAELDAPLHLPAGPQSEREALEAELRLLELQKELARLESSHFELEAQLARTRLEVLETERLIQELAEQQED